MLAIIQAAANRYSIDYKQHIVASCWGGNVHLLGLASFVQEYCTDLYDFEEEVFRGITSSFRMPSPAKQEDFIYAMSQAPKTGRLLLANRELQTWAEDLYLLGKHVAKMDGGLPEYYWLFAFYDAVHKTERVTPCYRPFCSWRWPPECICGRPLIL